MLDVGNVHPKLDPSVSLVEHGNRIVEVPGLGWIDSEGPPRGGLSPWGLSPWTQVPPPRPTSRRFRRELGFCGFHNFLRFFIDFLRELIRVRCEPMLQERFETFGLRRARFPQGDMEFRDGVAGIFRPGFASGPGGDWDDAPMQQRLFICQKGAAGKRKNPLWSTEHFI